MAESSSVRCHSDGPAVGGLLWLMGWLFTLGYLHLPFRRGVLALLIWPYSLRAGLAAR